MMYDCGFTKESNWFRYRAAAIIVENNCVLFATNEKEDYLYSIGGGVHMGEMAEDAVLREVFEETGVHYEIDHLAIIHENFFNMPFQIAYVIDPIQNIRGFFQWKNGKINKMTGFYVYDEIGRAIKISEKAK